MSKINDLDALAWEAGRRGISYGALTARMTEEELCRIRNCYREYITEKRKEEARRLRAEKARARRKKK